ESHMVSLTEKVAPILNAFPTTMWRTWWLYGCSEVLDMAESADAQGVLRRMEDVFGMQVTEATNEPLNDSDGGGGEEEEEGETKPVIVRISSPSMPKNPW